MKIATVVGARPQFIKASAISSAIKEFNSRYSVLRTSYKSVVIKEIIIHTGQHYDYEMSKLFFEELNIPRSKYNLGVGSGSHGLQTGQMLIKIEKVILKEKPDMVMVYGDTNSTLAGALAAAKLHIPVAHVEAGMRSFNREMPEEVNRVLTDYIAALHFCSTQTAVDNLKREGIKDGLHLVGDVMFDVALKSIAIAEKKSKILKTLKLKNKGYYLATVHRQSNTDNLKNLNNILDAFTALDKPVVFPVHPRTQKLIGDTSRRSWELSEKCPLIFTEPVGYLDMLILEKNAHKILTDSGGVQKEAYFVKTPCVTLRNETEWLETVESGWNILAGTKTKRIIEAAKAKVTPTSTNRVFGNGKASEKICKIIAKQNL